MNRPSPLYKRTGFLTFRLIIAAIVYVALFTVCVLCGNQALNLTFIIITALILADWLKLLLSLSVQISTKSNYLEGESGKILFLTVTYRNFTPFCYPVCRFDVTDSDGKVSLSPAFSIKPFGNHTISVPMDSLLCGTYTAIVPKITIWDSFGFFSITKKTGTNNVAVTVLPEIIKDRFPWIPKEENAPDEDFRFRAYQDGDNMRMVNWKKSAGSEELIVKETVEVKPSEDILLYVNSVNLENGLFRDTLASCAATLSALLLEKGRTVSFRCTSGGSVSGLPVRKALALAEFKAGDPDMSINTDNAETVYVVMPGIPADFGKIIGSPCLRDKNIRIFALIDDTQGEKVPEEYRFITPLYYSLLRRGGGKNG